MVRFDLGDLVRQHVDDVEPILAREGRRAIVDAPEPVEVVATLGAVGQALDILLSNAVRHGAGAVTATVAADERRARVDIADEGSGARGDLDGSVFVERTDAAGHGIGLVTRANPRDDRRRHDQPRAGRAARVPHRAAARLTESLPEAGAFGAVPIPYVRNEEQYRVRKEADAEAPNSPCRPAPATERTLGNGWRVWCARFRACHTGRR